MSPSLRLYFVRHGETAWSLSGQHTSVSDVPLTPNGEQMARDLAPTLAAINFSSVLTSPRLRARSTCALAGLESRARIEQNLAEWDYGDYEGLRTAEIQQAHPGWDIWRDGCPGGETPTQVADRADRLIADLQKLEGSVVLFSHGQFGRALAARWIGVPVTVGLHFAIDPASIGILSFEAGRPHRPVISLWNARPPPHTT